MSDPTIVCPRCKTEIKLNESLAAPLIEATKNQFEKKLLEKDEEILKRQENLDKKERQMAADKRKLDEQVAAKVTAQLESERVLISEEESRKAKFNSAVELESKSKEIVELNDVLKVRDQKLAEAQNAQVELIKKQRELDDTKRELELTVEKRIQDGLGEVRAKAKQDVENSLKLKLSEKDQTISSMHKKMEELIRKAEQQSQQLQGEVQELELEGLLRSKFPIDLIEPVAKGEFGGDALQKVIGSSGQKKRLYFMGVKTH